MADVDDDGEDDGDEEEDAEEREGVRKEKNWEMREYKSREGKMGMGM